MRRGPTVVAISLGVAAAVATATIRFATAPAPASSDTTGSVSTPTIVLAQWVSPTEIVIPPAVIVPNEVTVADGQIVVDYDVVSMAVGEIGAIHPTRWVLVAGAEEFEANLDPYATRAAFDVGFDFDPARISGMRLLEYVVWSPLQVDFRPAVDDFARHDLAPGVHAALDLVQQQTSGTIVRVQLSSDYVGAVSDLAAEGRGPGWVSASSNFGGGGLWTMSFEGDVLPDPIPLFVRGVIPIPVPTDRFLSLDGVRRG